MTRFSCCSAALLALTLFACGKKDAPVPEAAAPTPTEAMPEPKEDAKDEPKPEPKEEPKPEPTVAPAPVADATEPALNEVGLPRTITDAPTALVTATPGTIVKTPAPDSPEWVISQVLLAAMDPDEAKGWALFESLLHEDQKAVNALTSRRSLNFAASRRKVKLFLVEDPNQPIYQVDRVVEQSPKQVRIYVHNNSEGGMPTPCELRMDDTLKKWRVGICSL